MNGQSTLQSEALDIFRLKGFGDEAAGEAKLRWLRRHAADIREEVSRRIVLKYLPKFEYLLDHTATRGARILLVLDEIGHPQPTTEKDSE